MNFCRKITCGLSLLLVLLLAVPIPVWAAAADTQMETELQTETESADPAASVPLFFQTDYPNQRYGEGTVATSGCGITSLAMVASYMTGHTYYPDELADYFGGYGENNIRRLEHASDMLRLPWHQAENFHKIIEALQEGNLAILLMNSESIFTQSQHFIVLTGLTEDGKIMVHDPYAPNYEFWQLKNGFEKGFEEGDLLCGYSGGWIYDVNAMTGEPFIYTEEVPEAESRYPDMELTWEEQQLLAKVIWVEARGESADGQQAVAEIVFNRLCSDHFPDTLRDVIYGEGQFRSAPYLEDVTPWQAQYDAIEDALSGPNVLPENVVYFATYPVNDKVWGEIGGHIFCYE